MVKKHDYSASVELCSELMKKTKNYNVIPKFFIIYLHIFETHLERWSRWTKMWSLFSYYQFHLHSALERPSTTFSVQILGKIITFFWFEYFSNLCNNHLQFESLIFPTYDWNRCIFWFYSSNSRLMAKIDLFFWQIKQKNE